MGVEIFKDIFSTYENNYNFSLRFNNMVYNINRFPSIKPNLHFCNKSYSIMVYYIFNEVVNSTY